MGADDIRFRLSIRNGDTIKEKLKWPEWPPLAVAFRKPDLGVVVAVGLSTFYLAMSSYAVFVFQQFTMFQVIGVALAFGVLFLCLVTLFLSREIRKVVPRPSILSVVVGLALAGVLLLFAFTWLTTKSGPDWSQYFPIFPMTQLTRGGGFHQDSVFHLSLIQNILNFGYPSTGQNGTPFVPYHVLSHYTDAVVLKITGLQPFDSYALFFHFKVALFLSAVVVFLWAVAKNRGNRVFWMALLFLTPVLISTWIGIGSHALWLTSLILILSSKYVFESLAKEESSAKTYLVIFLIGVALGLGKVSSGAMFAVFVVLVLLFRDWRRWHPYALGVSWLLFFGVYWRLFKIGHSNGLQRPSLTGLAGFLNFNTTYSPGPPAMELAGLYILVALFVLFGWVFRSALTKRLLIASLVSILVVGLVTQTLAGLSQPDIFYFIYGLFIPVLLLGVQSLLGDLRKQQHLRGSIGFIKPRVLRSALVLLLILCTQPLPKPPLNFFNPKLAVAISDSVIAANIGYFNQYNGGLPVADKVSLKRILFDGFRLDFGDTKPSSPSRFRAALYRFMKTERLTPTDTLLFIPKQIYDSSLASFGGPSWARGMLVYAVTGIPVVSGIEDGSIKTFGQSSYGENALQRTSADFDPEAACSFGRQVIEVRSWDNAVFELKCDFGLGSSARVAGSGGRATVRRAP